MSLILSKATESVALDKMSDITPYTREYMNFDINKGLLPDFVPARFAVAATDLSTT